MRTLTELTAAFPELLARHDLPSMSADDLWFEIMAMRDGEGSGFIPPEWMTSRDADAIQRAADDVKAFWDEWEQAEHAERNR